MKRILGMGNALVDVMVQLEDDKFLEAFRLPKGSMQLVGSELSGNIIKETKHLKSSLSSGGSAANTIFGIASLGLETAFLGKISDDKLGEVFYTDLKSKNIESILLKSKTETGRAVALISPDSERTFATYLGAAVELNASDIKEDYFKAYDYFHIEGYLVQNHELLERALKEAKKQGMKISLDLASYNVVEENLDFLKKMIAGYVDIIFANEEEAKAYTGQDASSALKTLASECEIAVVKTGAKGSLVQKGNEVYSIDAMDAKRIDTTGAGDLYASGFLFGLAKDYDLAECGRIGTLLASRVIEIIGARLHEKDWKKIREELNSL